MQSPADRRGSRPGRGASGNGATPAGLESAIRGLRSDLGGLLAALRRTGRVEWHRLRWRAVEAASRAGLVLCLLGFGLAASISAALLVAYGIRGALAGWSRSEWLGDLGAGIATLGLVFAGAGILRFRARNECLRRSGRDREERESSGGDRP